MEEIWDEGVGKRRECDRMRMRDDKKETADRLNETAKELIDENWGLQMNGWTDKHCSAQSEWRSEEVAEKEMNGQPQKNSSRKISKDAETQRRGARWTSGQNVEEWIVGKIEQQRIVEDKGGSAVKLSIPQFWEYMRKWARKKIE